MPIYKNGSKIKAIYKGYTPIEKVYHGSTLIWQKKPSYKFEIIGTLTDNNGIFSGFNDQNYIQTPEITEQNITSYEQAMVFKINSTTPTTQYVLAGSVKDFGANMFAMPSRGRLMMKNASGGTGSNVRYEGITTGVWYGLKVSYSDISWDFFVSLDKGDSWEQFDKNILGVPDNIYQKLRIGRHYIDGYSFSGEVDMSRSYIKVNGVNLW